jgi:hypothetical protein
VSVWISKIRYALGGRGQLTKESARVPTFEGYVRAKMAALHYRLLLVLPLCWKNFKKTCKDVGREKEKEKFLDFDYFFCFYTSGYAGGRNRYTPNRGEKGRNFVTLERELCILFCTIILSGLGSE